MHYEEEIIDGVWCYRNNPNSEWIKFTLEELSERLMKLYEIQEIVYNAHMQADYIALELSELYGEEDFELEESLSGVLQQIDKLAKTNILNKG